MNVGYVLELYGGFYYVGKTAHARAQSSLGAAPQGRARQQADAAAPLQAVCAAVRGVSVAGVRLGDQHYGTMDAGQRREHVRGAGLSEPGSPTTGTTARKTRICSCARLVMRWT